MKKEMIILVLLGMYFSCSNNSNNQQDEILEPVHSDCETNGGKAGDTGLKTWCWAEIPVPLWDGDGDNFFLYKDQLKISNSDRWYENQIVNDGDRLKFHLNPTTTPVGLDPSDGYNYRAEIRTAPWDIQHPSGTEEWFGWSYTFGEDYVVDQINKWVFFQVHNGISGVSPQVYLYISDASSKNAGNVAGKVLVVNNGNNPDYLDTDIIPQPGQTLDIVVHVIWADASTGLLQVWIDDVNVYNKQVSTIYPEYPWGGNAKWGIYHPRWREGADVQNSLDQGITDVETFMGPLRIITRRPGDPDYGKDSFELVKPR